MELEQGCTIGATIFSDCTKYFNIYKRGYIKMDILFLQVVLYCLLFTLLVALSYRGNAINIIYFYPKSVIDKVVEFGYIDYKTVKRNKVIFYSLFIILMFGSLILIVGLWNKINDFKQAFIQLNIFLQSWNIFDGLVMDILWTSNSKKLKIKGIKDSEYIPGVIEVIKKRIIFIPVLLVAAFILAKFIVFMY